MKTKNLHEIVFPVITYGKTTQLWGTAFSIGGGYYMTAKHVVEAAMTSVKNNYAEHMGIGQPEPSDAGDDEWVFTSFEKEQLELHPSLDIAIFHVTDDFEIVSSLRWNLQGLHIFDDILSAGYPYSLDLTNKVINVRGIKGHIIGTGRHMLNDDNFQSYELSFNPPRGLSGCPIISPNDNEVCGVLVGNRTHEMEVFCSEEITINNQESEIYAKYEMMHIGIGIQSKEFLGYHFNLIGCTLVQHLDKFHLVVK